MKRILLLAVFALCLIPRCHAVTTIIQETKCSGNPNPACVFATNVTAGNYVVIAVVYNNIVTQFCSSYTVSDTLGSTYHFAFSPGAKVGVTIPMLGCIFYAALGSSGANTVTATYGANAWAIAFEVNGITSVGAVSTIANSAMPVTLSATAPTANSFLLCGTTTNSGTFPTTVTPGTLTLDTEDATAPAFGGRYIAVGYGIVAAGTQTCSFDSGIFGFMTIFGTPPASTRRRHKSVLY